MSDRVYRAVKYALLCVGLLLMTTSGPHGWETDYFNFWSGVSLCGVYINLLWGELFWGALEPFSEEHTWTDFWGTIGLCSYFFGLHNLVRFMASAEYTIWAYFGLYMVHVVLAGLSVLFFTYRFGREANDPKKKSTDEVVFGVLLGPSEWFSTEAWANWFDTYVIFNFFWWWSCIFMIIIPYVDLLSTLEKVVCTLFLLVTAFNIMTRLAKRDPTHYGADFLGLVTIAFLMLNWITILHMAFTGNPHLDTEIAYVLISHVTIFSGGHIYFTFRHPEENPMFHVVKWHHGFMFFVSVVLTLHFFIMVLGSLGV